MLNANGQRVLSYVVRIDKIEKHPNADSLDIATVGGWKTITKLGEYKPGDLAIYCEIDSWIPNTIAPFLTKAGKEPKEYNNVRGERLKTCKIRGILSQGLLLNPSILPKDIKVVFGLETDNILGIQKWEPPVSEFNPTFRANPNGKFPENIPKTDQERVQNFSFRLLEYVLNNNHFELTEKMDGTSMTIYEGLSGASICSRNFSLKMDDPSFGKSYYGLWFKEAFLEVEELLTKYPTIAFQGELCGPGIQKNKYKLNNYIWFIFDMFDMKKSEFLSPKERFQILEYLEEFKFITHVPIIDAEWKQNLSMEEMVNLAIGESQMVNGMPREGLVFKSHEDPSISFKVINNNFLLKED